MPQISYQPEDLVHHRDCPDFNCPGHLPEHMLRAAEAQMSTAPVVPRCRVCRCRCTGTNDVGCMCMDEYCSQCECEPPECDRCRCSCYDCGCNYSECDRCLCTPPRRVINDYSHRVTDDLVFLGNPPDGVYFGVELEVNTRHQYEEDDKAAEVLELLGEDFAECKHDGSVDPGFEIVTAPATLDVHRERWLRFLDASRDGGENNRPSNISTQRLNQCGMHVHISRPGDLHVGKMLVFMNDPKHQARIESIAGRSSNHWSQYQEKKIKDAIAGYFGRYEALNITNRDTVEVRIFRATTRASSFFRNLEFCHAMYYWTRDASVRNLTWEEFVNYVRRHAGEYPALLAHLDGTQRRIVTPSDKINKLFAKAKAKKEVRTCA